MHVQLSTAMKQWGIYDLNRDIDEIGAAVNYIRNTVCQSNPTNVVIMGHSTGCQDVLHYLQAPGKSRPVVQGAILQAPVSDREGILRECANNPEVDEHLQKCLHHISEIPEDKRRKFLLPLDLSIPVMGPTPVNAARFLSLVSPDSPQKPSLDDLFSSDLSDQRFRETFGKIGSVGMLKSAKDVKPSMLILCSGADSTVPDLIDKSKLLSRFKAAIEHSGAAVADEASLVIEGGAHDLSGDSAIARKGRLVDMRGAVLAYIDRVVGGVSKESWGVLEEEAVNARDPKDADSTGAQTGVQELKL